MCFPSEAGIKLHEIWDNRKKILLSKKIVVLDIDQAPKSWKLYFYLVLCLKFLWPEEVQAWPGKPFKTSQKLNFSGNFFLENDHDISRLDWKFDTRPCTNPRTHPCLTHHLWFFCTSFVLAVWNLHQLVHNVIDDRCLIDLRYVMVRRTRLVPCFGARTARDVPGRPGPQALALITAPRLFTKMMPPVSALPTVMKTVS